MDECRGWINAPGLKQISHGSENRTQINVNIPYSCTSTYSAQIVSQFTISALFPQYTSVCTFIYTSAHSSSRWRNWNPAKWNNLNKSMGLVMVDLDPIFYQRSNFLIDNLGFLPHFAPSPTNKTTKHLLWEKGTTVTWSKVRVTLGKSITTTSEVI